MSINTYKIEKQALMRIKNGIYTVCLEFKIGYVYINAKQLIINTSKHSLLALSP